MDSRHKITSFGVLVAIAIGTLAFLAVADSLPAPVPGNRVMRLRPSNPGPQESYLRTSVFVSIPVSARVISAISVTPVRPLQFPIADSVQPVEPSDGAQLVFHGEPSSWLQVRMEPTAVAAHVATPGDRRIASEPSPDRILVQVRAERRTGVIAEDGSYILNIDGRSSPVDTRLTPGYYRGILRGTIVWN